jgi:hypothetical protein
VRWLFSAPVDLAVFGGSAAVSLLLLALAPLVAPAGVAPEWTWITAVLLVDVAHVWSTAFVVYLDPVERRRRPLLYAAVPAAAYLAGVALHMAGEMIFWRVLAYLAVFHFVRQQVGWVALYRARGRETAGGLVDTATIYLATLYPLLVWHTGPRAFAWFREGDFAIGLPPVVAQVATYIYVAVLAAYVARALPQRPVPWGKHLVVATTAACWYLGIVATDSDYGFTVTNVFIHGVPYLALVYVYVRRTGTAVRLTPMAFVATLWALAYVEELVWDRGVWHERSYLFGGGWALDGWSDLLVPLLAVPQVTHYVLDGFLWRRRSNPRVAEVLARP